MTADFFQKKHPKVLQLSDAWGAFFYSPEKEMLCPPFFVFSSVQPLRLSGEKDAGALPAGLTADFRTNSPMQSKKGRSDPQKQKNFFKNLDFWQKGWGTNPKKSV